MILKDYIPKNYYIKNAIFPIVEMKIIKEKEELNYIKLLGTGFYIKGLNNIGITASSVLENIAIENIFCLGITVDNKWRPYKITGMESNVLKSGMAMFFVNDLSINCGINVNNQEQEAGCEFYLRGYPNEYISFCKNSSQYTLPNLIYHQGYVIREINSHYNNLFEVNLVLSEGCYGSPMLLKNNDNLELIGIYIGSNKYVINKGYQDLIKLIDSNDHFWEKLKSDKENWSFLGCIDRIVSHIPTSDLLSSVAKIFILETNRSSKEKSELKVFNQHIKDKKHFKYVITEIHNLMNEKINIECGIAINTSNYFNKLLA